MFDRFYRVKNSQGRSFEGSGIGLFLVRELVELHQGTIEAISILDKGSCFAVAIPKSSAYLPSDGIKDNSTDLDLASFNTNPYVQEALGWLQKPLPPEIQPQVTNVTLQPSSTRTARILLTDDNVDMRDYLARLLSSCYQVETVADGVAALDAVRTNPSDLVLSDVMMPSYRHS